MPKELPFHVVFSPRFSLIHVALVCSSGDMLLSSRLNSANLMKSPDCRPVPDKAMIPFVRPNWKRSICKAITAF